MLAVERRENSWGRRGVDFACWDQRINSLNSQKKGIILIHQFIGWSCYDKG
jgi:hypothetical protein